jgi:hypothetical protein
VAKCYSVYPLRNALHILVLLLDYNVSLECREIMDKTG